MFSSTEYQTESQWKTHYRDVRRRLDGHKTTPKPVEVIHDNEAPKRKLFLHEPIYEVWPDQEPVFYDSWDGGFPQNPPKKTWRQIVRECAADGNITWEEIIGDGREKRITPYRFKAIYRLKTELGWSFQYIGQMMGDRDHSSICYAYHRYVEMSTGYVSSILANWRKK